MNAKVFRLRNKKNKIEAEIKELDRKMRVANFQIKKAQDQKEEELKVVLEFENEKHGIKNVY